METFDRERIGTGTKEWSEISYNIQKGCSNGCLYCYAKGMALRFKKISDHAQWIEEKIRPKEIERNWTKINGTIMFPSTHDIIERNIALTIVVLKKMLEAGNNVLIVTKPRFSCIRVLCEELKKFKNNIMFRFTIDSICADTCRFWEPGAPDPGERLSALEYAYNQGYRTSVSMEPMLGGKEEAIRVFQAVNSFVSDTIWIGKMNKAQNRVDMSIPENRQMVNEIEFLQRNEEIKALVDILQGEPKIRWKDSIKIIIGS